MVLLEPSWLVAPCLVLGDRTTVPADASQDQVSETVRPKAILARYVSQCKSVRHYKIQCGWTSVHAVIFSKRSSGIAIHTQLHACHGPCVATLGRISSETRLFNICHSFTQEHFKTCTLVAISNINAPSSSMQSTAAQSYFSTARKSHCTRKNRLEDVQVNQSCHRWPPMGADVKLTSHLLPSNKLSSE